MNRIQALNTFWNSFGSKAYDENSVPNTATLPYITYEVADSDFDNIVFLTASLWYRSSSWKDITEKSMQISDYISRGGKRVNYDNGCLWIQRASPFAQRLKDSNDDMIRRIILNYTVEFVE